MCLVNSLCPVLAVFPSCCPSKSQPSFCQSCVVVTAVYLTPWVIGLKINVFFSCSADGRMCMSALFFVPLSGSKSAQLSFCYLPNFSCRFLNLLNVSSCHLSCLLVWSLHVFLLSLSFPFHQCLTFTLTLAGVSMLTDLWSAKSNVGLEASPVSPCCRPPTTPSLPAT